MGHIKDRVGLLICSLILSISVSSVAGVCRAGEKGSARHYVCNDLKGARRWEAAATIKPMKEKNMYLYTEEGSGVYSGFDGQVRWKAETEFTDDGGKIAPLRMKKTFVSPAGTIIFEGSQEFNAGKGEVTCIKQWPQTAKEARKTFRYDGDVVNEFLVGLYTERYLKNGEREKTYYLVTNDPDIYRITAKIEQEETITVIGKTVNAYKIHLKPDVGMLGIFASMLPQTYVWHLTNGDFNWLKYRGAEDTLDSPEVEMETLDKVG